MNEPPGPPAVERRRFPRRWRRARKALFGLLAILGLGVAGYVSFWRIGPPLLARISPSPARVGDTVTLDGQGFDPTLEGNVVYFADYSGRLVSASRTRLEVEVPEVGVLPGQEVRLPVKVQVEERKVSNALELVVRPSLEPEPGTGGSPEYDEEEGEEPPPSPR
jgi:hypothetical protein